MKKRWLSRLLAATLAVAFAAPSQLSAAPAGKEKLLDTLLTAAQKAFFAGDFARAADLYADLWRQDPSQPSYLYNAARSSHLGGQLDRAEDLYRQLIANPAADKAQVEKCKGYLAELLARKGQRKADEAAKVEGNGNYEAAAALWRDAYDLDPTRIGWLARAGRALDLAGKKAEAAAVYKTYLATAAKDAVERGDVERWNAEVQRTTAGPGAASSAKSPAGVGAPGVHKSEGGVPMTAWLALGGGALLLGGGAVLYMGAASDQQALEKDLDAAKTVVDGKTVWKLDYAEVEGRNAAIARNKTIGVALGGVGVVAAGVGAWLAVSAPKARVVALPAPDLGGVRLAWRF